MNRGAAGDPGCLREGASQADMTDVQSQKFAEELPNMRQLGKLARHNWLLTALIEYLTVLLEYFKFLQSRWKGTTGIW